MALLSHLFNYEALTLVRCHECVHQEAQIRITEELFKRLIARFVHCVPDDLEAYLWVLGPIAILLFIWGADIIL